ncbi:MAG: TonB-dependent receptor [Pseudomonadota bacterium]|nr:TonB-dependent receptor [Pseudomonadota bacterium]
MSPTLDLSPSAFVAEYRRSSTRGVTSLLALALLAANPAMAQERVGSHVAAEETPASDDARTLDTIVVTAQRRSEDARQVPLSVSVIAPGQLQAIGSSARDITALAAHAPSLHAESSFGRTFPRFYIRGLGNSDFDLNAAQPVSLVYDGVVMENPALKGFPVFDLNRVEVLRGPQGTLFGRNTPGGVVAFESVRPRFTRDGYARIGYGRFDTFNVEAAAGDTVSENSAARVSALYQRRSHISTNTARPDDRREGFTDRALRGQWLWQPNQDFEALLQLRARSLDGGSQVYRANSIVPGRGGTVPGFDRHSLDQDAVPTLRVDTVGASARLRWDLPGMRVLSISAYESVDMFARGDVDGGFGAAFAPPSGPGLIPFPAESGDGIPAHRQLTQEMRVESTGDSRADWQLGAFVFDESLDIDNVSYDTLNASVQNGFARQHQDNRAYAVFGSAGIAITPRWRLGGGLRFTRDEKDFRAERLTSPIGAGALAPITRNPSDSHLGGDLNLTWAATGAINVYGRVASGFRAPAIQGRLLFGDTVSVADSERILSWETGLKADLLDRRARLTVGAFQYTLDDAQLTAVGGQTNFNTLLNAERVAGSGVEIELEVRLGDNFTLAGGGSYNATKIRDRALAVQPCAIGCTVLDPPGMAAGTVSIDGNRLPQAPRWTGQLRGDYRRAFGAGELLLHADVAHRSEVKFFLYDSPEFTGAALTEVGARVAYAWNDGRREVAVFGRNLLDEVKVIGGVDFNNFTGFYNEPRVLGVELVVRL